jgi:hypothetical protein
MTGFSRRAASGFRIQDLGTTITISSVDFTFLHRCNAERFPESCSTWGLEQDTRTCILYFNFEIRETGQKCGINNAEVNIDFSTEHQTQLTIFHIMPAQEFKAPSSEKEYSETWTVAPTVDSPFGGGDFGNIGSAKKFEGLPDWRFYGCNWPAQKVHGVKWKWIRGAHYKHSRGVPPLVVGLAAKDHPETAFTGAVTMSIQPRHFWRNSKAECFTIEFIPLSPQADDLSESINRFRKANWEPILT